MNRIAALFFLLASTTAAGDLGGIDSIEVRLFYNHSGTLSEKLTGKESLRNTMIGGGDAKEASTSILVTVVLWGTHGGFVPQSEVTLLVKSARSGKVLSRQKQRVGVLSDAGTYHAPFLVNHTGCEPLLITASSGSHQKETTVPFTCGE
jgi:hypothetical protein